MHRRTVLGSVAVGLGLLSAGCIGSSVDGSVVSNETPTTLSHEHSTIATSTGTRTVVEVTVENDGNERITPEGRVPWITCTFTDGSGNRLHQSGLELVNPLDVGETTTLEFTLAVDVDDVARYELRSEWVET